MVYFNVKPKKDTGGKSCTVFRVKLIAAPTWLLLIHYSLIKNLLWELSPRKHVLHKRKWVLSTQFIFFSVFICFAQTDNKREREKSKTEDAATLYDVLYWIPGGNSIMKYIWWRTSIEISLADDIISTRSIVRAAFLLNQLWQHWQTI